MSTVDRSTGTRPSRPRWPLLPLIACLAALVLGGLFGAFLMGDNPSKYAEIEKDVSGEVEMISGDGDAIVIDGTSYAVVNPDASVHVGDDVAGTVLNVAISGPDNTEAVLLLARPEASRE